MNVWLNDWGVPNYAGKKGLDALLDDFEIDSSALDGCEILLASYTYQDYSGSAFVLFRKDGKLYEVNGVHCSCWGLEGQWDPEETSIEALRKRTGDGYEEYGPQLTALLNSLQ